jgi:GPI mannosyltransferase 3
VDWDWGGVHSPLDSTSHPSHLSNRYQQKSGCDLTVVNFEAWLMQLSTALALAVRVVIALITRTFFQPDEYFQALEPAHFLVFGYGDLTWEWTSNSPIRSIFYPFLNVPIYWLLKTFRLDGTFLLVRRLLPLLHNCTYERKVVAPKVLHGLLASGTDIWARELSRKTLGLRHVPATVSMLHLRFPMFDIERL